jgi:hypothetical protein
LPHWVTTQHCYIGTYLIEIGRKLMEGSFYLRSLVTTRLVLDQG